jgi:hypothetical protein
MEQSNQEDVEMRQYVDDGDRVSSRELKVLGHWLLANEFEVNEPDREGKEE